MENNKRYLVLAYYKFISIENPESEVENHKKFFENRNVTGRIYISNKGINGQLSGILEDAEAYMEWMKKDLRFDDIHFKIHQHHENIFPRMTVKTRQQLVALDIEVDLKNTGRHLSPKEWKEIIENENDFLMIDVRNDYEWEIGHFEGAELPSLETFRDFPHYADKLKEKVGPEKKILMYCTGGIRCELYSALLKEKGFKDVSQLEGGIINYGIKEGNAHWKGKVFVFDDRLAVPIDGEDADPIASCCHCQLSCDIYYNCANMDCNELFICCANCLHQYQGCCQYDCMHAPRLRPHSEEGSHKPFRREHLLKQG